MKIKKKGQSQRTKAWGITITCRKYDDHDQQGCGAILHVGSKDLVIMYYEGTHQRHHYAAVKCPQCGKYTHAGSIPGGIWKKVFTRKSRASARFDGMSESL